MNKQINIRVSQASGAKYERNERYFIMGNKKEKHQEQFAVDIATTLHKEKPFTGGFHVVVNHIFDTGYIVQNLQYNNVRANVRLFPCDDAVFPNDSVVIMLDMRGAKFLHDFLANPRNCNTTLILVQTTCPVFTLLRQFRYIALNNHIDKSFLKKAYAHVLGMFPTYDVFRATLKQLAEMEIGVEYFMFADTSPKSDFMHDTVKYYWTSASNRKDAMLCDSCTESDDESTNSSKIDMLLESTSYKINKPCSAKTTASIVPISFDNFQLEHNPKPPSFLVSAPTSSPITWTLVANILTKLQETQIFSEFYICTDRSSVPADQLFVCDEFKGMITLNGMLEFLGDIEKTISGKHAKRTTAIIFVNTLNRNNSSINEVLHNGRHYGISGIFVEDFPTCTNEKLANTDYLLFNIFSSAKFLLDMSNAFGEKFIDNLAKVDDSSVFAMCKMDARKDGNRVNYVKPNAEYVLKQQTTESAEIRNLKKSIEKYKKELAKKRRLLGETDSDSDSVL